MRTAIPVDGRFEHIVLSCNATADHGIIWIEREAEKALNVREIKIENLSTIYHMCFFRPELFGNLLKHRL